MYSGFTDEYIDEIKETLMGSNLYLLVLTALITALQVRLNNKILDKSLFLSVCTTVHLQTAHETKHTFGVPAHVVFYSSSVNSWLLKMTSVPGGRRGAWWECPGSLVRKSLSLKKEKELGLVSERF